VLISANLGPDYLLDASIESFYTDSYWVFLPKIGFIIVSESVINEPISLLSTSIKDLLISFSYAFLPVTLYQL